MTRAELEHAIRAACDVAEDTEVYVFGSQAILGQSASKLAAFREKDRRFVRVLLREGLVRGERLRDRLVKLPESGPAKERALGWLDDTLR